MIVLSKIFSFFKGKGLEGCILAYNILFLIFVRNNYTFSLDSLCIYIFLRISVTLANLFKNNKN